MNLFADDLSSLSGINTPTSSLRTDAAAELDKLSSRKSFVNTSTPVSSKDSSSTLSRTPSQDMQNSFSEC